jgi:hypothetical protein
MNATRAVSTVLAGTVLLAAAGGSGQSPVQPAPADAEVAAVRQELAAMLPDLEKGYGALDAKVRAMPRGMFEPSAVIEEVGRNPAALEKWVAEQTDLLPYRGALRGPAGVMMDRAGNSLDRSLLLASLLQSDGCEVRLANASLPAPQAAELASSIKPVRAHRPSAELTAEANEGRRRVERQTKAILDAIGAPTAESPGAAGVDRWAGALSDHWWVQRREGQQWVDADPCKLSPRPAAARTVPLKKLDGSLPLESKDCHEVMLSVVVEAFKGGKLTTGIVMQQIFRPSELLDRPLTLYHYMGVAAIGDGLYLSDDTSAKQMKDAIAAQEIFLPVLKIGANEIMSASFSIDGTIDRSPSIDPTGQVSGSKVMRGIFGGMTGGGGSGPKSDVLTAEWIEYEIRAPGEPPQRVRRMVVDLIGPAARAASAPAGAPHFGPAEKLRRGLILMGSTQIAMQPCEIPMQFVAFQATQQHLHEKQVFMSISKGEFQTFAQLTRKFDQLADFDLTRSVAMARGMIGPAERLFIDRPNILDYRLWAQEVPGGAVGVSDGMDMAFMSAGSLEPNGNAGFAARVAQGVADTLAEQWGRDPKSPSIENTLRLAERAAEERAAPTVVRKPADLTALGMPADVAARAASDLAEGNALVVSHVAAGRYGWWRVNARTGKTIGVMDNGYNGDESEYPAVQKKGRPQYIRQRMGPERFNKLDRQGYAKVARIEEVPADEWEFVEQLQGKVQKKALTVAEQLAKLKGPIKP